MTIMSINGIGSCHMDSSAVYLNCTTCRCTGIMDINIDQSCLAALIGKEAYGRSAVNSNFLCAVNSNFVDCHSAAVDNGASALRRQGNGVLGFILHVQCTAGVNRNDRGCRSLLLVGKITFQCHII